MTVTFQQVHFNLEECFYHMQYFGLSKTINYVKGQY